VALLGGGWQNKTMTNDGYLKEKFTVTGVLHEAGIAMMRQRFKREFPDNPSRAEAAFRRWLYREDDAIPGDVAGSVRVSKKMT
jgi:hypothetical protein